MINMENKYFLAAVLLIVGIYDMSFYYNRRHQPNNQKGLKAYLIFGVILFAAGILALFR
ncbi:DUF308 domain-containing protein [Lactobacillus mulieris]|uniref:DUF308 domain-containing protein n=1 Tax=Lactobacillus mulieris TaxID=2508708 RepID=A0AAW5WXZ6_9LACO|nr:DUF308 domain-containing protein [Lactobacillus mulieris]MCZ3622069.1 DUF308 domain-containing protein [Lactobacillus mulieris]MCZ3623766.1 DUF308 domain-containing protein [Lactobacillus mulieris]MCZ3636076.1 DUF308 domain-containing protein [Lactobacillus mulieris]MCZ3689993.1 DUF308 domain-containing protein [Lactobacillus mulieris]MCZ3696172.1 DUF308 domain-containing protein [Lactobacillus mulieris]